MPTTTTAQPTHRPAAAILSLLAGLFFLAAIPAYGLTHPDGTAADQAVVWSCVAAIALSIVALGYTARRR